MCRWREKKGLFLINIFLYFPQICKATSHRRPGGEQFDRADPARCPNESASGSCDAREKRFTDLPKSRPAAQASDL